jgi:hypothetical protein
MAQAVFHTSTNMWITTIQKLVREEAKLRLMWIGAVILKCYLTSLLFSQPRRKNACLHLEHKAGDSDLKPTPSSP